MTPEQPTQVPFEHIITAVCIASLVTIYTIALVREWYRNKKLNRSKLFSHAVVDTHD